MYTCNQCNKRYSTKASLHVHKSRVHLHPIIKAHHRAFELLSSASDENYKRIVDNTSSMTPAIKALFRHILNGKLKLGKHHINQLRPHKEIIREIAHGEDTMDVIKAGGTNIQSILTTVTPITALL